MEGIVHGIKLGENSHLISKYSTNKKIYYSKTYFDNNDILKSYNDVCNKNKKLWSIILL